VIFLLRLFRTEWTESVVLAVDFYSGLASVAMKLKGGDSLVRMRHESSLQLAVSCKVLPRNYPETQEHCRAAIHCG
jgi:hypothetical protein